MFDDPEGNHWLTPGVSLWMPSSLDGSSRRWRLTRAWSLTTPPSSNCRRLLLTCPRLKGPRAWKAPLGTFRHEHGSFKHSQVDGPRIYLFYILYIIHMCTLTTTHTHTQIYIYIICKYTSKSHSIILCLFFGGLPDTNINQLEGSCHLVSVQQPRRVLLNQV